MLSEQSFTIPPNATVHFGVGAVQQLGPTVAAHHVRAFVVTDRGLVAAGLVGPVVENLETAGLTVEVFDGVDPNPTDQNVEDGVDRLRALGDAVVVLLGGGSVMDAGKYIALAAPNDGKGLEFTIDARLDDNGVLDFLSLAPGRAPERDGHHVVAVPTTSGTASETNAGGLITDTERGRKLVFTHDSVKPRHVFLDPTLTVGLPPYVTATTGMDALTHSIEALASTASNPYADALALQAIETIANWLPVAVADGSDVEARSQMQVASHLAGLAFSSGPYLGLVHAMGHPVSGHLHQPHGQTLATLLPHVMRFNLPVRADTYARVARALGVETPGDAEARAVGAIEAVEALSERVGTAKTLSELGATPDVLSRLVDDALVDLMILTTPRPPSRQEVLELYQGAS